MRWNGGRADGLNSSSGRACPAGDDDDDENECCLRLRKDQPKLTGSLECPQRGCSSAGRASASQAEGRGFEPRRPLSKDPLSRTFWLGLIWATRVLCPEYVPSGA
jgi:hypothetical protein